MAETVDSAFSGSELNKADLLEWLQSANGVVATPHSQRSFAYITLTLEPNWPSFDGVIQLIESTLVTALQTPLNVKMNKLLLSLTPII